MSCFDGQLFCLCLLVAREQLATAQDKATRLCDANAMLTEQVAEAVRDYDATAADSSTMAIRAGQCGRAP